jgi:hypothetical protein
MGSRFASVALSRIGSYVLPRFRQLVRPQRDRRLDDERAASWDASQFIGLVLRSVSYGLFGEDVPGCSTLAGHRPIG